MDAALLLRTARERANLTQGELAARAGTSQPAISRYEAGTASPSITTLDRLLAAMGARVELIVSDAPRHLDVRTPRMAKLRAHRDQIMRAAHRHHASNVMIFGSVARGDDNPGSDVDFLVDLDVHRYGLFPIDDLRLELESLLHEHVDVAPRTLLADHVAERALAEAVPL